MNNKQAGFTLIELIAVIAILGILAAVAVPRFVNLQDSARIASLQATAGAMASAASMNYAAEIAREAGVNGSATPADVTNCTEALALLVDQPANVAQVTAPAAAPTADGQQFTCTINFTDTAASTDVTVTLLAAITT